jgi:cysteine synthase
MLQSNKITPGKTNTIVEYSSGSTVVSMSMMARILYGIQDTRAFLSNKTSHAKLQMMRFFGLNMCVLYSTLRTLLDALLIKPRSVFGGPSQPEPTDHRGGIYRAHQLARERDDTHNPNQYVNDLVRLNYSSIILNPSSSFLIVVCRIGERM